MRPPRSSRTLDPAAAADPAAARGAATGLLARRDYASGELRSRLLDRGYEPATVDAVIAEFLNLRYLDDARYAGHYVTYQAARGQGPMRIRQSLRTFGLAAELIEVALEGADFVAIARDVRRRKFGAAPPSSLRDKAKQTRFLQYRGFSNDHIRSALGHDPGEPFDPDL